MPDKKECKNPVIFKGFVLAQALAMLSFFVGCNSDEVSVIGGSYSLVIEAFDFGPAVTKIIIEPDEPLDANASDFKVHVVQKTMRGETLYKGERTIADAFKSDESGNKESGENRITLVMQSGPDDTACKALYYNAPTERNEWTEHQYTITHIPTGKVWNGFKTKRIPIAEDFEKSSITYEDITMDYAYYTPLKDSKKNPLIIWLHGAGEGGHDADIALIGNKVVNLASSEIQSIFDGAYVLVPQCPTMWMDNGTGSYTYNGVSEYTAALKNLIDSFVSETPDIDIGRIYIGGCSNGGFMTIRMLLSYPDFFAAAFPVCEAYYDSWITDKGIESLKTVPIWFTHSKNDATVSVETFTEATYKRLKEAGADVHFTCWDKVLDITGLYVTDDNQPYEYNGHFSWVYTLNNACRLDYDNSPVLLNGQEVSIMEWIAAQTLK